MVRYEVHSATTELRSLIVISSIPITLNCGVVIWLSLVNISTEWTNPFLTILCPSDEWIDISSAIFAPYNWVILEGNSWNLIS
jgi:hypothetical protein